MLNSDFSVNYSGHFANRVLTETDQQIGESVQLAWRLAFPDAGINISTREPSYLRDGLIGLGVTHMSAESSTEPGGYCNPDMALKQFDITDHRRIEEIFSVLKWDIFWKLTKNVEYSSKWSNLYESI